MTTIHSPRNAWRQETPGTSGWARSAHPGDPDKYLMISADCHAQEPATYLAEYIEPEFRDRIPRLERRDDGSEWIVTEGNRPQLVKRGESMATVQPRQSYERPEDDRHHPTRMEAEDVLRNKSGLAIEDRIRDQRRRRHRHRADLPQQGAAVLGDAATRCSPTPCAGRGTVGPTTGSAAPTAGTAA